VHCKFNFILGLAKLYKIMIVLTQKFVHLELAEYSLAISLRRLKGVGPN